MTSLNIEATNSCVNKSWSKSIFFTFLRQLDNCFIALNEGDSQYRFGNPQADMATTITIADPKAYQRLLWGGSIGAGEAYVEGLWYADDITKVIRIFSRNLAKLEKYEKRFGFLSNGVNRLRHRMKSNSKSRSRTNIAAHYDLSNDMYRFFLDQHMQYSSAIFPHSDSSLEQAQEYKMELICRQLELDENDHLLEVGTGWGGLACYAAKHFDCQVTTTTISPAQYQLAERRIKAEGLEDNITLLLEDYRDLTGQYSKIVSVEMIEAVGHKYMSTYFNKLDSLLQPGGKLLLQAITINDQRYDDYLKKVDFIQRYIFPGGHLPSVSLICQQMKQQTNLHLQHFTDYRLDYANTLKVWRQRFLNHKSEILALGFNEDFIRLWDYYFCYCEGGFREKVIGLAHFTFEKNHY